jgi:hypothetical protein
MDQPDRTVERPGDTVAEEPRPTLDVGTQLATAVMAIPVLVVLNNLLEWLVTGVVDLSPWLMAGVFAGLTALALRRHEGLGGTTAGTLWFVAGICWLVTLLDVLARLTGLPYLLLGGGVIAVVAAWRWVEVRRGLRESVRGPIRHRSE